MADRAQAVTPASPSPRPGPATRVGRDLRRLTRSRPAEIGLLSEASLALALAGVATCFLPFRWVAGFASRRPSAAAPAPHQRAELIRRVRWATAAAAKRSPLRPACLQQSLAAQWMLRRRGVPAVLYYGAAIDKTEGLQAHAWVKVGQAGVVGVESASAFAVLAQFPPGAS